MLKGHNHAVEIGEIHVLIGFTVYKSVSQEVEDKVIGLKTFDGIPIESYATHFINRVIGQTSTQHEGMRQGVPIEDVIEAIKNGGDVKMELSARGEKRMQYRGKKCSIVIGLENNRLIQVNPRRS